MGRWNKYSPVSNPIDFAAFRICIRVSVFINKMCGMTSGRQSKITWAASLVLYLVHAGFAGWSNDPWSFVALSGMAGWTYFVRTHLKELQRAAEDWPEVAQWATEFAKLQTTRTLWVLLCVMFFPSNIIGVFLEFDISWFPLWLLLYSMYTAAIPSIKIKNNALNKAKNKLKELAESMKPLPRPVPIPI